MNFKKTIAKIFLDLIPVAIGVYVGILGSNWNESQKTIESKDRTIERIKKEIEKNKSLILLCHLRFDCSFLGLLVVV